jgi:putative ABC transport system permease protein
VATWGPLLRIARRDALRAKGRSALIVAMIALPVLGLTATDVIFRSGQLDLSEHIARELGQTQARITWNSGVVQQAPDPDSGGYISNPPPQPLSDVPSLPSGYRIIETTFGQATVPTRTGRTPSPVTIAPIGDPALRGRYRIEHGRAPTAPDEIAVSKQLFDRLKVQLGDSIDAVQPAAHLRLVGVIDQVGNRNNDMIYAPPGTPISVPDPTTHNRYLVGSRPFTWTEVLALNRSGFIVTSRSVLLHPPPRSAVPFYQHKAARAALSAATLVRIVGITLAVGLAVLEVVLLAGAAFAVGTRRQERWLGLLSVAGGDARHSRRVVLAGGFVLGLAGALLGIVIGLAGAAIALAEIPKYTTTDFGHYDVRPLEIAGIALLGTLTGVAAAALPARSAGRLDPVAALSGRRGQVRTPRKVPTIGVALLGAGAGLAALGSTATLARTTSGKGISGGTTGMLAALVVGGSALAQIGLIVCSPALVGLAGRLSTRFPLPARLALRDASRHRGRSAPAVAAVLTAIAGSVAITLVVSATDAKDRREYLAAGPTGSVTVTLGTNASPGETVTPANAVAALRPVLPPFTAYSLRMINGRCNSSSGCTYVEIQPQKFRESGNSRLRGAYVSHPDALIVGGSDALPILANAPSSAAKDVFAHGGLVSFDPSLVRNGRAIVGYSTPAEMASTTTRDSLTVHEISVPAVYVKAQTPMVRTVLSEGLAQRLHLTPTVEQLVLRTVHTPTQAQQDGANAALPNSSISVERGYHSRYSSALLALVLGATVVTVGAAGISTGLAQADARADHATLLAVGATPRVRRSLAASQALAIAGLGSLLGLISGLVPALAYVGAVQSLTLVMPWGTLALLLVGIPILASAGAYLVTRSRLPLDRRMAT